MTSSALPASDFSVPDFSGRSDSHVCLILMLSRICGFQGAFNRKNQIKLFRVEMKGFEPLTPCLQGRCSPN